jgi:hypothetical protein
LLVLDPVDDNDEGVYVLVLVGEYTGVRVPFCSSTSTISNILGSCRYLCIFEGEVRISSIILHTSDWPRYLVVRLSCDNVEYTDLLLNNAAISAARSKGIAETVSEAEEDVEEAVVEEEVEEEEEAVGVGELDTDDEVTGGSGRLFLGQSVRWEAR